MIPASPRMNETLKGREYVFIIPPVPAATARSPCRRGHHIDIRRGALRTVVARYQDRDEIHVQDYDPLSRAKPTPWCVRILIVDQQGGRSRRDVLADTSTTRPTKGGFSEVSSGCHSKRAAITEHRVSTRRGDRTPKHDSNQHRNTIRTNTQESTFIASENP